MYTTKYYLREDKFTWTVLSSLNVIALKNIRQKGKEYSSESLNFGFHKKREIS
jgi:hypothetical protein